MKIVNLLTRLVLSSVLSLGLIGCKKLSGGVTNIPAPNRTVSDTTTPRGPAGGDDVPGGRGFQEPTDPSDSSIGPDPEAGVPLDSREYDGNYLVDRETFAEQTVYFDLDSSTISPGEKPKIDAVATHLKGEPTFHLRVEGHCDERGTEEYNRALGERRALSIREYLIALGVASDRISTLSYGEDKPAMFGSDEASWEKNRRGESVLLKPKD